MSVLDILKWPDARLNQLCHPVESGEDIETLVMDMFQTMYAAPGRGLAASQVGVMKRVFVMDATWKEGTRSPIAFINPQITAEAETYVAASEGCLSIPGLELEIERPAWVALEWVTPEGEVAARRFDGFAAACVQHEMDHLHGIVTLDHLEPEVRVEAEAAYAAARA